MKLLVLSSKISLCSCLLFLTACSVYKSQGRKDFESNAPASTVNLSSNKASTLENDTCWTQPSNEAIWQISEDTPLVIEKISDNEIKICTYNSADKD